MLNRQEDCLCQMYLRPYNSVSWGLPTDLLQLMSYAKWGVLNSHVIFFLEFWISESEFGFLDFSTADFKKNIRLESSESTMESEFCFRWWPQKFEPKIGIPNQVGLYVDVFVYFCEDPAVEWPFEQLLSQLITVDFWAQWNGFLAYMSNG